MMWEMEAGRGAYVPHLRLLVTANCDATCSFCHAGGEGLFEAHLMLPSPNELRTLSEIALDAGFRHIKISGGEPLVRPDITEVVSAIRQAGPLELINLGSNGIQVQRYAKSLKAVGLDSITISLNTLDAARYRSVTGVDQLPAILQGFRVCREVGLPVMINYVAMRWNLDEFWPIMEFAASVGASVKLMELTNVSENGPSYWLQEYVPLAELEPLLAARGQQIETMVPPGGIGIPLTRYRLDLGIDVLCVNPLNGVYYAGFCTSCPLYPCQDGVYALRITHSGLGKKCWFPIGTDRSVNLLHHLRTGRFDLVRTYMTATFEVLAASAPATEWSPEHERGRATMRMHQPSDSLAADRG